MTAALNKVQTCASLSCVRVYMDDRSFTCSSPQHLLQAVSSWGDWSQSVGLRESPAKLQLSASSPSRIAALRAVSPVGQVSEDFTILGCSAAVIRRGLSPKELQRVSSCLRVISLLGVCRLPYLRCFLFIRSFAISKILYGWVSRLPTVAVMDTVWARVRAATGIMYAANKHLRGLSFGGLCHPQCVPGTQLLGQVARLKRRGLQWASQPRKGTILSTFNSWLNVCGVQPSSQWTWEGDNDHCTISLENMDQLAMMAHRVRTIWRWNQWKRFLRSSRHEVPEFASSTEAQFFSINWEHVRTWCAMDPGMRSVACGAMLSPAALKAGHRDQFYHGCCWDGCEVTHVGFHHIAWECPHRANQTIQPRNPIDARFGWFDIDSLRWLGQIQTRLWSTPYRPDS
eukprot:Skav230987  [mRNA]  locus=scaffold629:165975:167171:- [translate_table: standard]